MQNSFEYVDRIGNDLIPQLLKVQKSCLEKLQTILIFRSN